MLRPIIEGFPWNGPTVDYPFPQYVGVQQSNHASQTMLLLQLLTGETVDISDDHEKKKEEDQFSKNKTECSNKNNDQTVFSYIYLVGPGCYEDDKVTCGACYKTTVGMNIDN